MLPAACKIDPFRVRHAPPSGCAASECYKDSTAADYRGTVSKTMSGLACLSWGIHKKSDGHKGYWTGSSGAAGKGVGNHGYCRNPNGEPTAWCYTTSSSKRWELCDVGKPKATCSNGAIS